MRIFILKLIRTLTKQRSEQRYVIIAMYKRTYMYIIRIINFCYKNPHSCYTYLFEQEQ